MLLNFQDGSVALHLACVRGFVDVADVLLTYGANVDVNHLQVFFYHVISLLRTSS